MCLRKVLVGKSHDYREDIFSKSSVFKKFSVYTKTQSRVFKSLRVEERFRNKAKFSWRISVDGRHNRRHKAAFSNPSGLKSVFVKLSSRDGSVWTVGLTVDIKSCVFKFLQRSTDGAAWKMTEIRCSFSSKKLRFNSFLMSTSCRLPLWYIYWTSPQSKSASLPKKNTEIY